MLVVAHTGLHQQARDPVLHLNHLLDQQSTVAQSAPPVTDLGRSHVALGKKITTKAVGYLVGIDLVILPLRRGYRPQHQRMCHLQCRG
jgi:hypothetical protein